LVRFETVPGFRAPTFVVVVLGRVLVGRVIYNRRRPPGLSLNHHVRGAVAAPERAAATTIRINTIVAAVRARRRLNGDRVF